jgi:beta-phosphoglucomutase-like phosphatase (HAD superfamily)
MAIKAILYDHDGTLVDSEVVHFGIWQKVLESLAPRAQLDLSDYQTLCGLPLVNNKIHYLKE